jgi:hypothetical protein
MLATSLIVRIVDVFSTSPSIQYGVRRAARDHGGPLIPEVRKLRLELKSERLGILGALSIGAVPLPAF